jgi:cephalosporin hydroxylase
MTLQELYQSGVDQWGGSPISFTDKGTDHDYLGFYSDRFGERENKRLLEIGVSSGGSAWLWTKWFHNSEIVGVDILPGFHTARDFQTDITAQFIWNFDSTNSRSYLRIPGDFDYIIDDGDHSPATQLATCRQAWPLLKSGGFYIIEDLTNLPTAQSVQKELQSRYPSQEWVIFVGERYPARQDDIIIWTIKL